MRRAGACLSGEQHGYLGAIGKGELLRDFAVKFIDWLGSIDVATHEGFNDLHALFGTVCCLAELQLALPGEILTTKPLKNVLDRRPFI